MMTLAPPEVRADVIAALEAEGCEYLDVHIVRDGVQVEIKDVQPA